jgi:hypothetical protein
MLVMVTMSGMQLGLRVYKEPPAPCLQMMAGTMTTFLLFKARMYVMSMFMHKCKFQCCVYGYSLSLRTNADLIRYSRCL